MAEGDAQPQLPAAVDWVMGMLEPGTKPGVFTFFKATTVALVICIATMLYALDVPSDVKFHLRVFLGLSICLMCITIWCVVGRGAAAGRGEGKRAEQRWRLSAERPQRVSARAHARARARRALSARRFFNELQNAPVAAPAAAAEEKKKEK